MAAGRGVARVAFGITAATRRGSARIGSRLERLGYDELWCNDTARGDGLTTLAAAGGSTRSLRFGVGVIALSGGSPLRIAERVGAAGVPAGRLTLGVGSGTSRSLGRVRDAVAELRRLLPDIPIAVAAVGPHMAHLAGQVADAVVANWALPDRLRSIRDRVAEGAEAANRPPPRLVAYVRTAVGAGATARLQSEMDRYRGYGHHYARAFDAQPSGLIGVAIESGDPSQVAAALGRYRSAVDTVVIRGLPSRDDVEGWLQVAATAAPP